MGGTSFGSGGLKRGCQARIAYLGKGSPPRVFGSDRSVSGTRTPTYSARRQVSCQYPSSQGERILSSIRGLCMGLVLRYELRSTQHCAVPLASTVVSRQHRVARSAYRSAMPVHKCYPLVKTRSPFPRGSGYHSLAFSSAWAQKQSRVSGIRLIISKMRFFTRSLLMLSTFATSAALTGSAPPSATIPVS